MLKTTCRVGVAILCAGIAVGGQNPVPAPPPREKPTDEAWLPKPGSDPKAGKDEARKKLPFGDPNRWQPPEDLATDPPSAFPDLFPAIPLENVKALRQRKEDFPKTCP